MQLNDPDKRPTAAEAYELFLAMVAQLSEADLSQLIWPSHWPPALRRLQRPRDSLWKRLKFLLC